MSILTSRYRSAIAIAVVALLFVLSPAGGAIVGISGTMSNFDVFNETGVNVYGAEIELEGCHATDVVKTYPCHFNTTNQVEVPLGTTFGTRITFSGYNFDPSGYITPTVGQSTNGHYAVNLPGCEHFGFAVTNQPTVTRFYWLDQALARIGASPMSIPNPTFTYVPPVGGNPPVLQAAVQPPEPVEFEPMLPDSIWMKVYVTELERNVELEELISGPSDKVIVPQDAAEVETEWELLEGGVASQADMPVGDKSQSIVRRYEYYRYTGDYDPEEHSPLSNWNGVGDPPADELGGFIAANMVAVNFEVPEPSGALILAVLGAFASIRRRSEKR